MFGTDRNVPIPSHGVPYTSWSMMDCRMASRADSPKRGRRRGRTTKGWVCGVVEKGSDWLGSYTGPYTKEVWTGKYARLYNKDKISHG